MNGAASRASTGTGAASAPTARKRVVRRVNFIVNDVSMSIVELEAELPFSNWSNERGTRRVTFGGGVGLIVGGQSSELLSLLPPRSHLQSGRTCLYSVE